MQCSVYIAMSLDGYIAKPDGDINWLMEYGSPDEVETYGFTEFLASVDVLIMGRKTFEKVQSFDTWPYGDRRVIVLSSTLKTISGAYRERVELYKGPLSELVNMLVIKKYHRAYIDGGKTIQSFLESDFITDMEITLVPILLGEGVPLFGSLQKEKKWNLVNSTSYKSGLVSLRYILAEKKERRL